MKSNKPSPYSSLCSLRNLPQPLHTLRSRIYSDKIWALASTHTCFAPKDKGNTKLPTEQVSLNQQSRLALVCQGKGVGGGPKEKEDHEGTHTDSWQCKICSSCSILIGTSSVVSWFQMAMSILFSRPCLCVHWSTCNVYRQGLQMIYGTLLQNSLKTLTSPWNSLCKKYYFPRIHIIQE